jgi:hypothetical protein
MFLYLHIEITQAENRTFDSSVLSLLIKIYVLHDITDPSSSPRLRPFVSSIKVSANVEFE